VYVLFGAGYVLLNYVVFEQLYCGGVLNLRRGMSGTLYLLLGSIDPRSRLEDESLLLKGGECHGLYLVLYFTPRFGRGPCGPHDCGDRSFLSRPCSPVPTSRFSIQYPSSLQQCIMTCYEAQDSQ